MSGVTPLITQLKDLGTFYTFQSGADDLKYFTDNPKRKIKFSKFALLDIPTIERPTNNLNTIQFDAIEGSYLSGLSTASPQPAGDRIDFAQWMQNYMFNIETLVYRSTKYDIKVKRSVAERIFWKSLKEIGAIRFRTAGVGEKYSSLTDSRFVEEDNNSSNTGDLYNRIVKYVGEIDVSGDLKSNTNAYKEIYINIPTQVGSTPVIMFKSVSDINYGAGKAITKENNADVEYISGRSASDSPTLAGLIVDAFYDMDVSGDLVYHLNSTPNLRWFESLIALGPNAYFTDPVFGDPTNDLITRDTNPHTTLVTYKRSRLDGICLDFETQNYQAFRDQAINSFAQYSSLSSAGDFTYNAAAVYYDMWDTDNPSDVVSNLYGILFFDNLSNISVSGAKILPQRKVKPSLALNKNGNGFAWKINIKTDSANENPTVDVQVSVNDYNTFSVQTFFEAIMKISKANINLENATIQINSLKLAVQELSGLVLTDESKLDIMTQIESLRNEISNIQTNQGLSDIITQLNNRINEILQGNTTVELSYVFNAKGYKGIKVQEKNKQIQIINQRQAYDKLYRQTFDANGSLTLKNNLFLLGEWDSMAVHYNKGVSKTASGNIIIYIDDSVNVWQQSQKFIIGFEDDIDFGSYGIIIYTDAKNLRGLTSAYAQPVGIISNITTKKPKVEIICNNPKTFEFITLLS